MNHLGKAVHLLELDINEALAIAEPGIRFSVALQAGQATHERSDGVVDVIVSDDEYLLIVLQAAVNELVGNRWRI
ncbi:hypothetical protein D3C73_1641240 [compost metagenome]